MNKAYLFGTVYEEPIKYIKNGRIHARTILRVKNSIGKVNYLPVTLRGTSADKFAVLAHKGSVVAIEGEIETNTYRASRLKRAIEIQIFATDFFVLKKEQMLVMENEKLEYVVKLYDPERYLK